MFANTKVPLSNIESAPAAGFGYGKKDSGLGGGGKGSSSSFPGPGAYKVNTDGRKKGGVPFGTASREAAGKMFISAEHDKVAGGGNVSPGPAAYSVGLKAVRKRAPVAVIGRSPCFFGGK